MKVYISVDMEGVAGISHPDPTGRDDQGYPAAVELMTGEANAAIEGALEGGADEVVVNDSHGGMFNLPPAKIHPEARLVQGLKAMSMVEAAADRPADLAMFIGYHARAGHPAGTLGHTYSNRTIITTIGGRRIGETTINAMYLGGLGIPVALVSGDDALAEEVGEWLPWATYVTVKHATGGQSAASLHPSRACGLIRAAAADVVRRAASADRGGLRPLSLEAPIEVGVEFVRPVQADLAAVIPHVVRDGDRAIRYAAEDPTDAYRAFVSTIRMASLVP